MVKRLYDIFSKKPCCEVLAGIAKQALEICEVLELCAKEVRVNVSVVMNRKEKEKLMLEYRKKLLKMILGGDAPKECKKEDFNKLRNHTINYFKYLEGFDFKDQKKMKKII